MSPAAHASSAGPLRRAGLALAWVCVIGVLGYAGRRLVLLPEWAALVGWSCALVLGTWVVSRWQLNRQAAQRAAALAQRHGAQARAAVRRLDAVIDSTADGIVTLDLSGHMLSANLAAERMFGLDRSLLEGEGIALILPSLAADAGSGDPLATLRSGGPEQALQGRRELGAVRADGTPFTIELNLATVELDSGVQVVCSMRDLTDAKAADEAIAMTMHELNAVTEQQQAMLRHAAFAIVMTDSDGMVRAFNPAAERLLEVQADQVVNQENFQRFFDAEEMATLAGAWREGTGADIAPGVPYLAASLREGTSVEHELNLRRSDGRRIPVSLTVSALRDESGGIASLLMIAYDVSARRQMVAEMTQLAYTDRLTGLANRGQFERELPRALAQAQRDASHLALLFIDLDRFKPINDTHGHAMGDRVLCEVAARLRRSTRAADVVARLGGDEFVVLCPKLAQSAHSAVVAEKILLALSEPMQFEEHTLQVGASIGVVTYPEGGSDAQALLESADLAMYEAKQAGRNCFRMAAAAPCEP